MEIILIIVGLVALGGVFTIGFQFIAGIFGMAIMPVLKYWYLTIPCLFIAACFPWYWALAIIFAILNISYTAYHKSKI